MQASERQKWNVRHMAGSVLAGLWKRVEPQRRHEMNDTMVAAAARVSTTAAWFDHVFGRFGIALEDCQSGDSNERMDVLIARLPWAPLREAVEENPALITMIAKEGPLPADLAPAEDDAQDPKPWAMPIPTGDLIPVPAMRSLWTNQSPMAHGADSRHGNVVLFRREPLVDLLTGEIVRCPFISGNSIRHSWRSLAVNHLYRLMRLDKKSVNPELHHSLSSGGVIDAGSEMAKVDPGLRAGMRHLFPAFELFGGIAEKQVCHGAFDVHDATLVCRENVSRLMHPALYAPPVGTEELAVAAANAIGPDARKETRSTYAKALAVTLKPALAFLTLRQYTKHIDPDVQTDADARHALWDTEVAIPGAQWVHFCSVHPTATELARSAIRLVFEEFERYPYLAAGNNKGHGLVSTTPYLAGSTMSGSDLYIAHLEANRDVIAEWLTSGKVPESAIPKTADGPKADARRSRR